TMRDAIYDLLCAFLLGLGNMFLFMGQCYDTQLAIVEPVLRSVHDRAPDTVSAHAGFYGAGMCTVFFMLASLVSPCVLGVLGSKYTLLLGSLLFTVHLASFQYIHYLPYYITSAGIGIGYALFYSGHGGYLTEHSTKKTIERNSALTWALATSCMIAGGGVLALTARQPAQELVVNGTTLVDDLVNGTVHETKSRSFRTYSDAEIKMVYGAFAGVCLLGNLVFILIPSKNVANSIAARFGRKRVGFVDQMQKIYDTFTDARALQLTPLFCFLGLSTCFWVGAYPTTLIFSRALSGYIYLPALYLSTLGLGEILMGLIIAVASKRIKNFAQLPSLILGSVLFMVAMVLALLSTPPAATNSPTSDPTPLLEPNPAIALIIALLLGMSDNSFNTSRTVLCALVIPENIAQSLAESIIFFVAPMMSMSVHFGLISFFCFISIIFYWRAAKSTRRAEKE
ncbi:hypothetical protein PMAYCL1PPCAC_15213, partial [Pristionchus mayeri]